VLGNEQRGNVHSLRPYFNLHTRHTETWCRADLVAALKENSIPCAPVNTVSEYTDDPTLFMAGVLDKIAVLGLGDVVWPGPAFRLEGERPKRRPAPRIGEHSDEILGSLGMSADEIAQLRERRIVG
jgi:formyl-CoA transferase